jgi:hypothetical protein
MFQDTCWYAEFFLFWYVELMPKVCSHVSLTLCIIFGTQIYSDLLCPCRCTIYSTLQVMCNSEMLVLEHKILNFPSAQNHRGTSHWTFMVANCWWWFCFWAVMTCVCAWCYDISEIHTASIFRATLKVAVCISKKSATSCIFTWYNSWRTELTWMMWGTYGYISFY